MATRFGIVQFPGSCDETDTLLACSRVGDAELLWHKDTDLGGVDVVVLPGGFSYGDYLRVGAIVQFAPIMGAVAEHAAGGGLVLGICNGFQVLTEAGLLPGALLPNTNLRFTCQQADLIVENTETPFTHESAPGEIISVPAKHGAGRFYAPPELLAQIEDGGQVLLRYAEGHNFNGSVNDIAGVTNEGRNVFGLMPHPEHAVDPLTGSDDALKLFHSLASAAPMAVGSGDMT
ncbi:MAG: phosphoribosylformylglycinamidine synthase subunit PurQ [Actinobacteria bacterium]|nr:phosphoribosylformylglycinamidine synthase subunit PurQ [Actinomycetota bacterium]